MASTQKKYLVGIKDNPRCKSCIRSHIAKYHKLCFGIVMSIYMPMVSSGEVLSWAPEPNGILSDEWDTFFGAPGLRLTNWSGNRRVSDGDSLLFGQAGNLLRNTSTNDLDEINLRNIQFNADLTGTHTIEGKEIDLIATETNDGIASFSNANQVISTDLRLQGNRTLSFFVDDGGQLTLSGKIIDSGATGISSNTTAASFSKDGDGTLLLSGSNGGMKGNIDLKQGVMKLGDGDVLSNDTRVTVFAGAKLDFEGTAENFGNISGDGLIDLFGPAQMRFGLDNDNTSFVGAIGGSSSSKIIKDGRGLTVLGARMNTLYLGDIDIVDGTLRLANSDSKGTLNDRTDVFVDRSGTLSLAAGLRNVGSLRGTGKVILESGSALKVGASTDRRSNTFSGFISGSGDLIKETDSNFVLNGVNSFTGATRINGGTIRLASCLFCTASTGTSSTTGQIFSTLKGGVILDGATSTFDIRESNQSLAFVSLLDGFILGSGSLDSKNGVFDLRKGLVSTNLVGNSRVVKKGSGTVSMTGNNSYSNGVSIEEGNLVATSTALKGIVFNQGTLTLDGGGNFSNRINGSGKVVKNDGVFASLTSTNNMYSGDTLIEDGILGFAENSSSALSKVYIDSGGTGRFSGTNTIAGVNDGQNANSGAGRLQLLSSELTIDTAGQNSEFNGRIDGNGKIVKTGLGAQSFFGETSNRIGYEVAQGTLIGNENSLGNNTIANNARLQIQQSGDGIFAGTISGSGSVEISSTNGFVAFQGQNKTYTGFTSLKQGRLIFDGTGTSAAQSALLFENQAGQGASLTNVGDNKISRLLSLGGNPSQTSINIQSGSLSIDGSLDSSFNGSIVGSGKLIKDGIGTLTLLGRGTSFGVDIEIAGGTLLGDNNSLSSSNIVNNAILRLNQEQNGLYTNNISGTGQVIKQGRADARFAGVNTYAGLTRVRDGKLIFEDGSSSSNSAAFISDFATLQSNGTNTLAGLRGDREASLVINGQTTIRNIQDDSYFGDISGSGQLIKDGSGTLSLFGEITQALGTIVNNGILHFQSFSNYNSDGAFIQNGGETIIDGTFKTQSMTINGGVISGSGQIEADTVIVAEDSSIAPGNSPGTLILMSDLEFRGGFEGEFENQLNFDQLNVDGTVSLYETSFFNFDFFDTFVAQEGLQFDFLNALDFDFGAAGTFDSWFNLDKFSVNGLASQFSWAISYTESVNQSEYSYLSLIITENNDFVPSVSTPSLLFMFVSGFLGLIVFSRNRSKLMLIKL